MDAKIASKVIAERIKKQLPDIIHNNQSGYIAGRYIGENVRSILDIMDYAKAKNLPGFFMFIDFEKTFDSLEWTILSKLSSCRYLLSDVIVGFLREERDLEDYVLLLGKVYLWDCRRNDNKPSITHFLQILKNKYDTEKLISKKKQNKYQSFKNKWHLYERHILYI